MNRTLQCSLLALLGWVAVGFASAFAGETAVAVAEVKAGYVTDITVVSGGAGYLHEPVVTLTGGGGQGATAKAFLAGDRVDFIVVTTAGQGYLSAPTVVVEPPPKEESLAVRLVPALTVDGPAGATRGIEWSASMSGPWSLWTNVVIGSNGTIVVDLTPGAVARYYRLTGANPLPDTPGLIEMSPGKFWMGSAASEPAHQSDELQHEVTLRDAYWISDHEVTQAEFLAVMGYNPSLFLALFLPVESVSWGEAVAYCERLTERERVAGRIGSDWAYRLPTEAEWEYAARSGGAQTSAPDLEATAWFVGNSGSAPHVGKTRKPNALGLYDMMGNVWEWCADAYGDYPAGPLTNPMGDPDGVFRVFRGGSWFSAARNCRPACRFRVDPEYRSETLGFRTVLAPARPR